MTVIGKEIFILKTSNIWEKIKHLSCLSDTTGNNIAEIGKLQK